MKLFKNKFYFGIKILLNALMALAILYSLSVKFTADYGFTIVQGNAYTYKIPNLYKRTSMLPFTLDDLRVIFGISWMYGLDFFEFFDLSNSNYLLLNAKNLGIKNSDAKTNFYDPIIIYFENKKYPYKNNSEFLAKKDFADSYQSKLDKYNFEPNSDYAYRFVDKETLEKPAFRFTKKELVFSYDITNSDYQIKNSDWYFRLENKLKDYKTKKNKQLNVKKYTCSSEYFADGFVIEVTGLSSNSCSPKNAEKWLNKGKEKIISYRTKNSKGNLE